MHPLAFLLYPFALLFGGITRLRNFLYDQGVLKSHQSQTPSILVGNLRVGGTGKTPMVEFLIRAFKDERKLATLSRGYGRKTKGLLQALPDSSPSYIGDEPFQIFQKFGNEIKVFVGEDRVQAENVIHQLPERPELLILDDAFQHRSFKAHFSILLSTWDDPFFKDYLMPMGRLRESRKGAKRADVVVISKSPERIETDQKNEIIREVRDYAGLEKPVLFSSIGYGDPVAISEQSQFSKKVILFSGIAQTDILEDYCRKNFEVLNFHKFPDHHDYTEEDLAKLKRESESYPKGELVFLTTEKDGVKVKNLLPNGFLGEIPIFVLPIQVVFSPEDEQKLIDLIQQKVFT